MIVAEEVGCRRPRTPPAFSLHSDFIDSSSPEFRAIPRKMVSNMVSYQNTPRQC